MDEGNNDPRDWHKANGQFELCNGYGFRGGRARAEKLSPERRREIAAMGFQALADKYFKGDRRKCRDWLVDAGILTQLFGREYMRRTHPLPDPGSD